VLSLIYHTIKINALLGGSEINFVGVDTAVSGLLAGAGIYMESISIYSGTVSNRVLTHLLGERRKRRSSH
jgi:hypothetical protein